MLLLFLIEIRQGLQKSLNKSYKAYSQQVSQPLKKDRNPYGWIISHFYSCGEILQGGLHHPQNAIGKAGKQSTFQHLCLAIPILLLSLFKGIPILFKDHFKGSKAVFADVF